MPDEENDKIIRDAADHYHPEYDDKAWEKMEQLLDQHLPQKKKKRKIIFFLLPLLLAGGLVFYMIAENGEKTSPPAKEISISTDKTQKSIPALTPTDLPGTLSKNSSSGEQETDRQSLGKKKNVSQMLTSNAGKNITGVASINSIYQGEKNSGKNNFKNNKITSSDETVTNQKDANDNGKNNSDVGLPSSSTSLSSNQQENKQNSIANTHAVTKPENIAKVEKTQNTTTKKETKKPKNNFAGNFGISISAGPDISSVQLNNPGKVAINFGLGFSYAITPTFTLRTGFYADKKIYSVGPDDYNTTAGTGNYGYLDNVDANCIVYSIPVNINYNFKKVKNHNWFLSTGLSSYLMKKESYEYYYKYPSGQTDSKDWTIHNQNQNIFSILNLSGGYQYSFNKRTSVMAEPYVNLPLSGVGAGKVKLKSGGILFTLTVKPFLKKK